MRKLSSEEIIRCIQSREEFEATATDTGLRIRVGHYVPFVGMAIHAGSKVREELEVKCALDDYQRWYEEDPDTDAFIGSMPSRLWAPTAGLRTTSTAHPKTPFTPKRGAEKCGGAR